MRSKLIKITSSLFIASLLLFTLTNCNNKDKAPPEINPAFSAYISAFTSGVVSAESTIRIRLTQVVDEHIDYEKPIDEDLFDFDPSIDGEAYWVDDRTIEFRPEEKLPSGTIYDAEFEIGDLMDVDDGLETFVFQFQTIKQNLQVEVGGMKPYVKRELQWQMVNGTMLTADVADEADVEKTLTAKQDGKKLNIRWSHEADRKMHSFTIDSISRKEEAEEVLLAWNGEGLGIELEGDQPVEIPALGDFKIMNTKVVQQPEQYVALQFSDPLDEEQNLDGLITFEPYTSARFVIEDNDIRVYPSVRQSGTTKITVSSGVKNILGYRMEKDASIEVTFEDIKPAVRLLGDGVILPSTNGLIFPFEAVNLSHVNLTIIRIYESNVGQFLQVNRLDGDREMKRVGRPVFNETVALTTDKAIDYGKWNTFSFDLAKYVQQEPGAIYRVELNFKQKHSMYPCPGDEDDATANMEETETDWDNEDENESSNWDYYDDYYYYDYYYYDDYDWRERDNPCHKTYYYQSDRKVSRNVIASDLGIIAKGGTNGSMQFVVNDLLSTDPMADVTLEIYNFQQQLITSTTTDGDGMANIDLKKKPFYVVAKKGTQRGYMRLDDGSSLSLSKFDVAGATVQKGIKGFLYGERGVWRPGDSLHLAFILEDEDENLPSTHPVLFELINPQGQTVQKKVLTKHVNGFYNFSTKTEQGAITGYYTAKVRVGGATFTKRIRVEAIKPNRLKLALDFAKETLTPFDSDLAGELKAKWLHGAIAKNLKADVEVTLQQSSTNFERFKDFTFDDPVNKFESEAQMLYDGSLNSEGVASVKANLKVKDRAPGMLKAHFVTRVFEKSGDFSIDRFSIPYAPYKGFVGVKIPKGDKKRGMLLTDTTHTIDVVTVDAEGSPVQSSNLEAKVYKVGWRWWWQKGSDDELANYIGSRNVTPVAEETISTNSKGFGKFKFKVKYPDWGRYLVRITDKNTGHSTGETIYIDWPGWAGRAQRENPGGASMLSFSLNKEKYNVGENVDVTIPTGGVGRALVSIESGSKIIESHWVEAKEKETVFSFKATGDMAPNVYVNVTLVQPHEQTANDLPIRMYGVMPLMVEDPTTKIEPVINMPNELAPEQQVTIKVKEKNGEPMTYTVAVVDEGLLDLTRFQTPDPWNSFYAREALGVKTWDMYDMVMGAFAGEMAGLLALGGDEDAEGGGKNRANRFKPMVKFLGPFELNSNSTGTHTFKMPNYIGSVRTMVIAGQDGAYGNAEKTTPVKKPLMVLATLPRVVGPGEQVKLPVTVFAMDKKVKNVSVQVKANKFFKVNGEKTKSIYFKDIGDEVIEFDLGVIEKIGIGKVEVIAKSGNEVAKHEIEIDVRNPNPPVTNVIEALVEPGQTWESAYTPPGMTGTNKGVIEVSSIPPLNLEQRLQYLIRYPHGCVEQTTSSVFPQLALNELLDLDNNTKARIESNVKEGIKRLKGFQRNDGGFSYWPGQADPNDWSTTYVGHFLLEAESRGYNVPSGMKKKWAKYQKQAARNWAPNYSGSSYYYYRSDLTQAYRLYTLALAKKPELGAMNRLKEQKKLSLQARWRLAAAYQLAGKPEVANQLIANASMSIPDYKEMAYTYGSSERDYAMILETLSLMDKRNKAKPAVDAISDRMGSGRYMSTQSTAYCLIAMSKFVGNSTTSKGIAFDYSLNNSGMKANSTNSPIAQIDMGIKGTSSGNLKVKNTGKGMLYARIIITGTPITGDQTAAEENLLLDIAYRDMNGNIINPATLEQGTDFMAEVTIKNPGARGNYKEMALTQVFPSGWEIRNTRMDGFTNVNEADQPEYRDIQDDRVLSYFDIQRGKTKKYRVLLNASYLGKFYLPTVTCEAMYDNTINARKPGQWVEVVQPGLALGN